jgi:hypothetical protein
MAPEPSAFISQMLEVEFVFTPSLPGLRFLADSKAILLPSGDHTGLRLLAPEAVSLVNGVAPEPSGLMRQMFAVPFAFAASRFGSRARPEAKASAGD